jgi:DNA-directed RNA polymerase subunit RPC12/RpoP
MTDNKQINRFAHLLREAENLSSTNDEHLFYYINRISADKMVVMIEVGASESIIDETIKTALTEEKISEKVFYTQAYFDQLARMEALRRKPDCATICMDCGKHIQASEERFPDYATKTAQVRCKRCCFKEIENWMKQQDEEDDDIGDDTDK